MTIYYYDAALDPNYNNVTRLLKAVANPPIACYRKGEASGTVLVDEIGSHNGIYANAPTLGQVGAIRQDADTCVYYDGVNDHARIPHAAALNTLTTMTVVVWVRTTSTADMQILAKYDHGLNKRQWVMNLNSGGVSGRFLAQVSSDGTLTSTTGKTYAYDGAALTDGNWHFLAITWNNGTLKMYVDGAEIVPTSKFRDGTFTSIFDTDADVTIGCSIIHSTGGLTR